MRLFGSDVRREIAESVGARGGCLAGQRRPKMAVMLRALVTELTPPFAMRTIRHVWRRSRGLGATHAPLRAEATRRVVLWTIRSALRRLSLPPAGEFRE